MALHFDPHKLFAKYEHNLFPSKSSSKLPNLHKKIQVKDDSTENIKLKQQLLTKQTAKYYREPYQITNSTIFNNTKVISINKIPNFDEII